MRSSRRSSAAHAERPTVYLTIDTKEQLPAAEAVIAAMYDVPKAVSSLQQEQMVHALAIADMVGAKAAVQQALQALQAAAKQGLTAGAAAALQAVVLSLRVPPAAVLQLLPSIVAHAPCCKVDAADFKAVAAADAGGALQQLLLAAFGDLQAVWADRELQALLLRMPL
uniref:Uncharacterized protein n=1 Tax=Tetradesmus obliquus TaxID=3088 RepID=A0A383WNT6_TETOB|eukprot:jgi/Sobl393_1/18807/SZX79115.1